MQDIVPSGLNRLTAASLPELENLIAESGITGKLIVVKEVPGEMITKGYIVYGIEIGSSKKEPFAYRCNQCQKFSLEAPRIQDYDDGRGKGYDILCIKCNDVMSKHNSRWG